MSTFEYLGGKLASWMRICKRLLDWSSPRKALIWTLLTDGRCNLGDCGEEAFINASVQLSSSSWVRVNGVNAATGLGGPHHTSLTPCTGMTIAY